MARRPRFIVEKQPHHIVQRGHSRAAVFFCEDDYSYYLECLQGAAERYGCALHGWCLMTNHIHLLATPETKTGLSSMMQMIGRLYVRHVNKRERRSGALWEDRFKVSLVGAEDYLLACMRYIEMNPVRARMVKKPEDYKWSSHAANALGVLDAGAVVTPHPLYRALGDTWEARQEAYRALFGRVSGTEELERIRVAIQGNWVLGSDEFREKMERKTKLAAQPADKGGDRRSRLFRRKPGGRAREAA
ncbi:MAG: transposase [Alphaproteobacteria bacterium]|nr:transposase [Alphaproteobacteria bacterium]